MAHASALQGSKFQSDFEGRWADLGKWGWLHRFEDAADLFGRNNKTIVHTSTKPCDYVVGYRGLVALVEAKSTLDLKGFKTSMLRQSQRIAIFKSFVAETAHFVAVRNDNTMEVFMVPGRIVHISKGIIPWASLAPYLWEEKTCPNIRM